MSIKLTNQPVLPYSLILLISFVSLYGAFIIEYILHYQVCPLCIYQRFPYLIFVALTIISLSGGNLSDLYYLLNFALAISLATYHSAIERGLLEMSGFCKPLVQVSAQLSIEDFTEMLYTSSSQLGQCNQVVLSFLSLSLTEWNLVINIFLLIIFLILKKYYKTRAKTLLSY